MSESTPAVDDPRVEIVARAIGRDLLNDFWEPIIWWEWVDVAHDIVAALDAHDRNQGIVRVPYDPSDEMIAAGAEELRGYIYKAGPQAGQVWCVMIDARPNADEKTTR